VQKALRFFRQVGLLEGASFLVLLFIAMPLKYFAGLPLGVRVVGMAHGVLFILYVAALYYVASELRWSRGKVAVAFFASLVPFGTILLDGRLRREEQSLGAAS
jgi:integral membrane protein